MTNKQDDEEGLSGLLKRNFPEYKVEVVGCEVLFWARTDNQEAGEMRDKK